MGSETSSSCTKTFSKPNGCPKPIITPPCKNIPEVIFTSLVQRAPTFSCRHEPDSEFGICSTGSRNKDGTLDCSVDSDCKMIACNPGMRSIDQENIPGGVENIPDLIEKEAKRLCETRKNPQYCDSLSVTAVQTANGAQATGFYTCPETKK